MLDRLILILCFTLNLLVTLAVAGLILVYHYLPAGRDDLWGIVASGREHFGGERWLGPVAVAMVVANLCYLVVVLGRPADGKFLSLAVPAGRVRIRRTALLASLGETVRGVEGVRRARVRLREEGEGRFRVRISLEASEREPLGPLAEQVRTRVSRRLEEMVNLSTPAAVQVDVEIRGFGRFERG